MQSVSIHKVNKFELSKLNTNKWESVMNLNIYDFQSICIYQISYEVFKKI